MKRKISLGRWFRVVFRLLAGMRRLRGTKLDVFGYAHVRKVERELIGEYRTAVREAGPAVRLAIAELPDMIRGYEHIKLDNVAAYRERMTELLASAQLQSPVGSAA